MRVRLLFALCAAAAFMVGCDQSPPGTADKPKSVARGSAPANYQPNTITEWKVK